MKHAQDAEAGLQELLNEAKATRKAAEADAARKVAAEKAAASCSNRSSANSPSNIPRLSRIEGSSVASPRDLVTPQQGMTRQQLEEQHEFAIRSRGPLSPHPFSPQLSTGQSPISLVAALERTPGLAESEYASAAAAASLPEDKLRAVQSAEELFDQYSASQHSPTGTLHKMHLQSACTSPQVSSSEWAKVWSEANSQLRSAPSPPQATVTKSEFIEQVFWSHEVAKLNQAEEAMAEKLRKLRQSSPERIRRYRDKTPPRSRGEEGGLRGPDSIQVWRNQRALRRAAELARDTQGTSDTDAGAVFSGNRSQRVLTPEVGAVIRMLRTGSELLEDEPSLLTL